MNAMEIFKKNLGPVAKAVEKETGIKAFIGLGQAAHESAYGASGLSSLASTLNVVDNAGAILRVGPANNYFGFTAELGTYWRSKNLPFVLMPTTEWKNGVAYKTTRPFRAYSTPEESYRDWARLMRTEAYTKAGAPAALVAGDVAAFALAMKKIGYATDPTYAAKITRVIGTIGNIA